MRRPNADKRKIQCRFFSFLVSLRKRIYYADGRGNSPSLGRHSLVASNLKEALKNLEVLDRKLAIEQGLADRSVLIEVGALSLAEGRALYEAHLNRPAVTGGTRPATRKRYRAVLDKFLAFGSTNGIANWTQVNKGVLERYARHLEELGRAYNTQYLELTTLKQINKWLIEERHLPESARIRLKMPREKESTRYCWTPDEFRAMLEHCRTMPDLSWLGNILLTLGLTGMRISELAQLRWSDVDLVEQQIRLVDESRRGGRNSGRRQRTLKNKRGRAFPIHPELQPTLKQLPRHVDGYVFRGPRGGQIKPDTLRNILIKEVLKPSAGRFPAAAGESGFTSGRLHSFRHFFCSLRANSGVPERVVIDWLGHADAAMVRRYYHLNADESRR